MDFMGAAIFQQDGGSFWNGGPSPSSHLGHMNVYEFYHDIGVFLVNFTDI